MAERFTEMLEWWLNTSQVVWTVGIDIDLASGCIVFVGVRYLGKSPHRKRWTRCSFGTHILAEKAHALGLAPTCSIIADKLCASYTEYANFPHPNVNVFHKRRRTRSMKGK